MNELNLENIKVGRKEIASICGYSEKYINELVRDFNFPKDEHNKYPLVAFLQRLVEYNNEKHQTEIDKLKNDKPQDDLARKNAYLKQLEIDEIEGRLIDKSIYEEEHLKEMGILKTAFDSLGTKVAPRLKNEPDVRKIKSLIDNEVNKIFGNYANL